MDNFNRGTTDSTGKQRVCKSCGQPLKKGRHKPGEYEHAEGCPRKPKPHKTLRQLMEEQRQKFYGGAA